MSKDTPKPKRESKEAQDLIYRAGRLSQTMSSIAIRMQQLVLYPTNNESDRDDLVRSLDKEFTILRAELVEVEDAMVRLWADD